MIEVFVESIRVNITNYKRVVMLKEKTNSRFLPIWIGHFEADAIAIPMQNVPVSRPLTHDLLSSVVSALGATVTQVVINRLADETFYAKLIIEVSRWERERLTEGVLGSVSTLPVPSAGACDADDGGAENLGDAAVPVPFP